MLCMVYVSVMCVSVCVCSMCVVCVRAVVCGYVCGGVHAHTGMVSWPSSIFWSLQDPKVTPSLSLLACQQSCLGCPLSFISQSFQTPGSLLLSHMQHLIKGCQPARSPGHPAPPSLRGPTSSLEPSLLILSPSHSWKRPEVVTLIHIAN